MKEKTRYETEVKIRIDRAKLEEMTKFLGTAEYFNQRNVFYQTGSSFIRLRREKGNTVVTYKGPRQDDRFGSREELEFSLEGEEKCDLLVTMFEKMGITKTLRYEKRRAEYNFGPCKICLDDTSKGNFVEIESSYNDNIEKTMAFFGLKEKDIEKRSYLDLFKEVCDGETK